MRWSRCTTLLDPSPSAVHTSPPACSRVRLDEVALTLESLGVSVRLVARPPEPPRDAERLEGDAAVNAAVRLQAKRVRQELGRLRTALVVKADREFGEGEGRAIYVGRQER